MSQLPIHFFSEDILFVIKDKKHIRDWIKDTIASEGKKLKELNIIFCSDNYLLEINQQYLKHSTFTDVITFDNSDNPKHLVGDIFLSVDRIRENAVKFYTTERDEIHRVIIHGTLHLLGYTDKTRAAKGVMSTKEDYYLSTRHF